MNISACVDKFCWLAYDDMNYDFGNSIILANSESWWNSEAAFRRCSSNKRLQHRCFPVNLAKFIWKAFFINTSGGCFWKFRIHWESYHTSTHADKPERGEKPDNDNKSQYMLIFFILSVRIWKPFTIPEFFSQ